MKVAYVDYPRIAVTQEFVDRNKFTLSRTQEEIIARIEKPTAPSFFAQFEVEVLVDYADTMKCLHLFTDEYQSKVRAGEVVPDPPITDVLEAAQDFLDYMNFAWGKCLDERGISANRSCVKLSTWLWLLGREEVGEPLLGDWEDYGASALCEVCNELGIELPEEMKSRA